MEIAKLELIHYGIIASVILPFIVFCVISGINFKKSVAKSLRDARLKDTHRIERTVAEED